MDYKAVNKASWNIRTASHIESDFYDVPRFLNGKNSLNSIELELLGDVAGKSVLHLQCHFGQDSLSLARKGAKVTGMDLSDAAIEKARALNTRLNLNADFICCDLYDLPNHLDKQFDIVFTSYGTICWLPDLDRWAAVVNRFLKPGGEFVMAEFHPFVWVYDDSLSAVTYNYFNDGPIKETSTGSYTDGANDFTADYITWNHPLSEVITALLDQKLTLNTCQEFDYSPYNCFEQTVEVAPGKFQLKPFENKIPLVYALKCTKS